MKWVMTFSAFAWAKLLRLQGLCVRNWMRSNFQVNLINYMRIQKEKECTGYIHRWKSKNSCYYSFVFKKNVLFFLNEKHQGGSYEVKYLSPVDSMIKFLNTTFWFLKVGWLWCCMFHRNQKVVFQNFIIELTGDKYFTRKILLKCKGIKKFEDLECYFKKHSQSSNFHTIPLHYAQI